MGLFRDRRSKGKVVEIADTQKPASSDTPAPPYSSKHPVRSHKQNLEVSRRPRELRTSNINKE